MSIYRLLTQRIAEGKKTLCVLIDPEKCFGAALARFAQLINEAKPQLILVGGSQWKASLDTTVVTLQQYTDIPVVLFPGNALQLSEHADAMLFLSLLSGRNADFLISQQVKAAPLLRNVGIETISTGYVLVDGGVHSAVERMSNTQPLKAIDEIVDTAIAAEMIGYKIIYLEAGSGAKIPVSAETITAVRNAVSLPLIVGGGITNVQSIKRALDAGADIIVVGNHFEQSPEDLRQFVRCFE